ncbi:MAG: SufE family protein [Alphaproteobacteria bacterium]|nr:SufE family protein [Alphaproteobacteria bacterium]
MTTAAHQADEIVDEFAFFDDWEDRYQHLIDLGRKLPPLDERYKTDEFRLMGCQSVVHFATETEGETLTFHAASDAAIVQGLIAVMMRVYSGQSAADILATPPEFLNKIGLDEHLSPTRKNGLAAMVTAIMSEAGKAQT